MENARDTRPVILPYSAHITYSREYSGDEDMGMTEHLDPPSLRNVWGEIVNLPFAGKPEVESKCHHCQFVLGRFREFDEKRSEGGQVLGRLRLYHTAVAWKCPRCGWWLLSLHQSLRYSDGMNSADIKGTDKFYEGAIYVFDITNVNTPITALRHEIANRNIDLCNISPRDLEILTGSVLRDYLQCKVQHIGGPNDQGIDLLLAEGDTPIIVQVKRRERPDRAEAVSVVRELLGTMVLHGINKGIVVSTVSHFSSQSKRAVLQARERLGFEIDLYNQDRLLEVLRVTEPPEKPWLPFIPKDMWGWAKKDWDVDLFGKRAEGLDAYMQSLVDRSQRTGNDQRTSR